MSEKVLFEYIADDGEGNSRTMVSEELKSKRPFQVVCKTFLHGDESHSFHGSKRYKRARRRVRKTLDMFEDIYDEIFGEEESS